jgi:4-alpha-glucanotransferase
LGSRGNQFERGSGILLHPTSLPGPDGIGDLGEGAYRFIDWLVAAQQRYWQVMPMVPTGYGDSPYAALSAFAGNPLLISLDILTGDGLLDPHAFRSTPFSERHVNYTGATTQKERALRAAHERFKSLQQDARVAEFRAFVKRERWWLDEFALFASLKTANAESSWLDWPEELRARVPSSLKAQREALRQEIDFHEFCQWIFRRQWINLRSYANQRGISIIGDIPIFVALDSADVWANPKLFRLKPDLQPLVVAGVPPDYFSKSGQRWGNPLYDWQAMAADNYRWWIERFRATLEIVDIARIDHFRGFAANWSVPADEATAENGWWDRGPGRALFDAIYSAIPDVGIIVEDLGLITPDVVALREELNLPGMAVLQFAFDGDPSNDYLPHNVSANSVMYTGTHDNQTTVGWYQQLPDVYRAQLLSYLGRDGNDIAWDLVRTALASQSQIAIVPMQDILRLGDEARMNTPGRPEGNWGWRIKWSDLDAGLAEGLGLLTFLTGRNLGERQRSGSDPFDYTQPGAAHPLHDIMAG